MRKTACMVTLTIGLLPATYAEPYTPDLNAVVAEWDKSETSPIAEVRAETAGDGNAQSAVQLANAYLAKAGLPGQARLYGLAEAALNPWVNKQNPAPEALLAWARVQQHKHEFGGAMAALNQILAKQPQHVSANLTAARISLVQGDTETAGRACLRLLGHADLLTVSACSLEVASFDGKLEDSYQQLQQIVSRQGLPSGPRGPWLSQMLADMALRLDKPQAALDWLKQPLETADVSYLAQWADAQLAVNEPQKVLDQLGPLVQSAPAMDDALLLRLAQAEKQRGSGENWQQYLAERVTLREQRQDTQHASDLARYYLYIDPQPNKALHWAKLNWQSAREPSDKALLDEAIAVAEQAGIESSDKREG